MPQLYEVWFSTGSGIHSGPKFRLERDALRYIEEHAGLASFAIRSPDGHWVARPRTRLARGSRSMPVP